MSRRTLAGVLLVAFAVVAGSASATPSSAGDAAPHGKPKCIDVKTWVKYDYPGWDQMVTLTSTCPSEARCEVTTSTNPEPTSVDVPAGESVDVRTWMSSPSKEFTATVDCTGGT
ncbi:MAG: hypothetical protein ACHREM_13190 [Polyangiales bacterium]